MQAGRWVSDMWSWRKPTSIAWCSSNDKQGRRDPHHIRSRSALCVTAPSFVSTKILVYSTDGTYIDNDMWDQSLLGIHISETEAASLRIAAELMASDRWV
jgi:hypothetical protein